jgi:hypothetical protein
MGYLDKDTDLHTNHNVYILGAGFSKNAGMPLLKDFLNELRSSVNWLKAGGRSEVDATREVLLFRKSAASAALRVNMNVENIEDLFSLAAASGEESAADNISTAIAATIEYCRSTSKQPKSLEVAVATNCTPPTSWKKTNEGDERRTKFKAQLYDLYAGFLNGDLCDPQDYMNNTVITFNYDTVLEDALMNIDIPIDYGFQEDWTTYDDSWPKPKTKKNALKLLKVHGSVNWFQNEPELQNLTIYRSYGVGVSKDLMPHRHVAIVPPTWRKDFSGPLTDVWRQSIHALRDATRIIFVGFSFPDTDAHIKYLLAAGLQENISLRNIYCINPVDSVKENFMKIIKADLEEQGIAMFCPGYTSRLLNRFAGEYDSFPTLFNRAITDNFAISPFTLLGEEPDSDHLRHF